MNLKKISSGCLYTSILIFLFVVLVFKKNREGQEGGSDEVKIGKNWKLKPILPNKEQIKELQKTGKKIDTKNLPKNLAVMFSPEEGSEWEKKYIFYPTGVIEGKEFKKMEIK